MSMQSGVLSVNSSTNVRAIILAAGKGTRMPSARPKALQSVLGDAMISHVYHAIEKLSQCPQIDLQDIWTVVGHGAQEVTKHIEKIHGEASAKRCVLQEKQLGTGHAVLTVLDSLKADFFPHSGSACSQKSAEENLEKKTCATKILVVNADTPLIKTSVLEDFILRAQNVPVAFMSLVLPEPASYGRVVRTDFEENLNALLLQKADDMSENSRKQKMAQANVGTVSRIIEAKDFKKEFNTQETYAEIFEVNAGIYLVDFDILEKILPQISTANESGEYYLTDLVSLAHTQGYLVEAISSCACDNLAGESLKTTLSLPMQTSQAQKLSLYPSSEKIQVSHISHIEQANTMFSALLGVNTPLELSQAEKCMQEQENSRRLQSGVVIHAPEMVRISPYATIEAGVEIFGPCEIYGKSYVGKNTRIESHCVIENTHISEACLVRSFCHFVDAHMGARTSIGPYARLRPSAHLAEEVHVGNFVEIKKSDIGFGSKINHLSYIGDSEVGAGVNVGAGCITCNYDGVYKHKTVIQDKAFLGSNCAFVAPVTIGKNSLVGAGSVITKDVPENSLAIGRSRQQCIHKKG